MNNKRYILTAVVVFVFIWVFDLLVHGMLLKSLYEQTATLWRTSADMQHYYWAMLVGQILTALLFSYLYARCHHEGGIASGSRFGFGLGLLIALPNAFMWYAVLAIPGMLAVYWAISGIVFFTLIGCLCGWLYRK